MFRVRPSPYIVHFFLKYFFLHKIYSWTYYFPRLCWLYRSHYNIRLNDQKLWMIEIYTLNYFNSNVNLHYNVSLYMHYRYTYIFFFSVCASFKNLFQNIFVSEFLCYLYTIYRRIWIYRNIQLLKITQNTFSMVLGHLLPGQLPP